jgi:hypothetical protein
MAGLVSELKGRGDKPISTIEGISAEYGITVAEEGFGFTISDGDRYLFVPYHSFSVSVGLENGELLELHVTRHVVKLHGRRLQCLLAAFEQAKIVRISPVGAKYVEAAVRANKAIVTTVEILDEDAPDENAPAPENEARAGGDTAEKPRRPRKTGSEKAKVTAVDETDGDGSIEAPE